MRLFLFIAVHEVECLKKYLYGHVDCGLKRFKEIDNCDC